MNNYKLPIHIVSILGLVLIVYVTILCFQQYKSMSGQYELLRLSATSSVTSVQDTAIVTLGVVSDGATAQEVKNQSAMQMNQVISFIKNSGIVDTNIKTDRFNIFPKYDYDNKQRQIIGYQANQTITVKIQNIDKSTEQLETILDGAIINGANQVQNIQFSFQDDDALIQIARKQAIDKAKHDATQLAKYADLKLGKVINVITTDTHMPVPQYASAMALDRSTAPSIEIGTQEVFATVTVVFQLK